MAERDTERRVPVSPRLFPRILALLIFGVAGSAFLAGGLWQAAIAVWVTGFAAFMWYSTWYARRQRAAAQAIGALPDYTAWEADAGRRLALLTVCAVGAIAVGLIIATIIVALH
jgi:hypothetical protein